MGSVLAQTATAPVSVEDRVYPPRNGSQTAAASPSSTAAADADGVVMLMQQMQRFEEDIQRLQGEVEKLRHELDAGRTAERERYLDLDTRINALAEAASTTVAPAAAQGDAATPSMESDREAYVAAREKLLARDFAAAGSAFESYLKDYPKGQFRPFAHFWLGEIYRSQDKPDAAKAQAQFQKVVDDFPTHSQVPAALYKLATLQAEQGDKTRARVTLNRILNEYEGSSEARLAKTMLEQLK
ncbi:tol-pal system protein YbgF [Isoalcanivorax beigongshangi]|uniref:Cell division coordinator CpoB n=1 Tax=Isoalcanivorax beigongshangi TaxID=3238810 RepID=A0ABV4AHV7_9GAMM